MHYSIQHLPRDLRFVPAIVLFVCLVCGVATAEELPTWTPDASRARADVPDIYKWDLSPLFDSAEAWEASRQSLTAEAPKIGNYRGQLQDPAALRSCLELYFRVHDETNRITLYAGLLADSDTGNEEYQAMTQQGLALLDLVMAESAFIRTEVLALSDKSLVKAYKKEPELHAYQTYIDNLRRRRGSLLDEDGERVLGLVGDNLWAEIDLNEIPAPPEDAFFALMSDIPWPTITDSEGQEVELNLSTYSKYRRDEDREVRRQAVSAMMGVLRQYQHAFAATLGGQAEFDVTLARSRNYDTALEAYLDKDNLDPAVYHTLIATITANLEPLHRYVELRKNVMDVDEVHLYDLYVPMLVTTGSEVPFPQARDTIQSALAPLGEEYVAMLTEGLDPASGWLDLYPSDGKDSGAFCASVYGRKPYVKMNYFDSSRDMSTLAHEYGHAMHSHLSMENQSYADFRYVPFLAEIASTANEALLTDYLLAHATDDRVRAGILLDRVESIRATIFRQTLFAEFELALHQFIEDGTPITASLLDETYASLVRKYYGPGFTMDPDDGMEWAFIPHFYWKYYVFTYATGLSSGIAISRLVQQGPEQRDAYLNMLGAGCSLPPLEILAGAGVDLTQPDAIESAILLFDETLTELEELLPKLAAEDAMKAGEETPAK